MRSGFADGRWAQPHSFAQSGTLLAHGSCRRGGPKPQRFSGKLQPELGSGSGNSSSEARSVGRPPLAFGSEQTTPT